MPRMTIEEARKLSKREIATMARKLVIWAEQNDATIELAHDVRTLVKLAYDDVIESDDADRAREEEEAAQKAEDAQIEAEAQALARQNKVQQRAAELAQPKPAATIPAPAPVADDDAQPNTNT